MPTKPVGQDFGLLQAIDERLAMYGWLTNTGVKFVIVVDMSGRVVQPQGGKTMLPLGLKNSDLTPSFRALQNAYIRLLRNPFYAPDDHSPTPSNARHQAGSMQITSKSFIQEVGRIGRSWTPEVAAR
ncbi:hypothetical protein MBLNU457_3791t1 [Dothideomycetes sp. NU457]